jgi:aminoglycoside phosphotransferase
MQPLRHSYTNDTRGDGRVVVKRYEGPDAVARRDRERLMLVRLAGLLPVPALLDVDVSGELRMEFVVGVHGQELIEAGTAGPVLRACGQMLRRIHDLDLAEVLPGQPHPAGAVLVHGDYGPNNVLLDSTTFAVTAVLDWEWAHPGDAVEDLAWAEWIVRMHHSSCVPALDEFFDAYRQRPSWQQRQAAMVAQCQRLLDVCHRWNSAAVRVWQDRLEVTSAWVE